MSGLDQLKATGAFVKVSLPNIKMGVETDEWSPPLAPEILGFTKIEQIGDITDVSGTDPTAAPLNNFIACGGATNSGLVTLQWQTTTETTEPNLTGYFVGTAAESHLFQVDAATTSQDLQLAVGVHTIQVVTVNDRNQESEVATCDLMVDDVTPNLALNLQPDQLVAGDFEIVATATEAKLSHYQITIKDFSGQIVLQGSELVEPIGASPTPADQSPDVAAQSPAEFKLNWSTVNFPEAKFTVEATATDLAGNAGQVTQTVQLDNIAPVSNFTMTIAAPNEAQTHLTNSSFENDFLAWESQGEVRSATIDDAEIKPIAGQKMMVLGGGTSGQPQINSISLISQDLQNVDNLADSTTNSNSANQVQTIGFWYNLVAKTDASSSDEAMMV